MSVERRDTATRCERCERVTLGVRSLGLFEGSSLVHVGQICTRCRGELKPALVELLRVRVTA